MIVYPVKAVTFDINGTLIHAPRLGEIYAETLSRHGIEVEPEIAYETVRRVWQEFALSKRPGFDVFASHPGGSKGFWYEFIDRVCLHLDVSAPSPFAKAELYQRFSRAESWEVYPEVEEVLESLTEKGVRCAVVSNWDDRLPGLLRDLGLHDHFEVVVYSQAIGVDKPFPEIFHEALEVMLVQPEHVVHIGDRVREDVEGARGAGMQAIHLSRNDDKGDLKDLRPLLELLPEQPQLEGSDA